MKYTDFKEYCELNNKEYLLKEWDSKDVLPQDIKPYANIKIWWKDDKGHRWQALPYKRFTRNQGCPYCANRKIISDENSLEALYPKIAKRWDYDKNGEIKPSMIPPKTAKKFYFKCEKGHSFQSKVCHMVDSNIICPICTREKKTSISQLAIYYYLLKIFPDAKQNISFDFLINKELDIYIPSLKIGIEYDGQAWHQDISKDLSKNQICKDNGIVLYRIREPKCPKLNSSSIDIYIKDVYYKDLNLGIIELFNELELEYDFKIDILNDFDEILKLGDFCKKKNSFAEKFPELLKYWDYNKNTILPEEIASRSSKKVNWICEKGHCFKASVSKISIGERCPYCANKKVIKGENDLKTLCPEIINFWDEENLLPEDFFGKSGKMVSLKCPKCNFKWNEQPIRIVKRKYICRNCKDI